MPPQAEEPRAAPRLYQPKDDELYDLVDELEGPKVKNSTKEATAIAKIYSESEKYRVLTIALTLS